LLIRRFGLDSPDPGEPVAAAPAES
jgi:hypothetical protein